MDKTLIGAGAACIMAAIVGGGLRAFGVEIPALSSIRRQLLLGVFGAALILIPLLPQETLPWLNRNRTVMTTSTTAPDAPASSGFDYTTQFQADRTDELRLSRDGEQAFGRGDYAWAIRFLTQAKQVQGSGVWQSNFPFLYGSQLALGKTSDAAATRAEMVDAIKIATRTGNGYLSLKTPLGFVLSSLGTVRRVLPSKHHADLDSLIDEVTTYQASAQ
jgi:hypothetical protein